MPGLTAKVFRTYNASITLQQELDKMEEEECTTMEEKVLFFNRANRMVAILCNHQRTLPKTHNQQMEKIDEQIEELENEKTILQGYYKKAKKGESFEVAEEAESPKKRIPRDPERLKKRIQTLNEKIRKIKIKKIEKVCEFLFFLKFLFVNIISLLLCYH